ncbi:MAG: hypothetical protein GTO03_03170 [Planctomycetales bacterium]|nr:hypothetical protein [Planctomycetales bacterium]
MSSKSEEGGCYRRRAQPRRSRLSRVASTTRSAPGDVALRRPAAWQQRPTAAVPAAETVAEPPSEADGNPAWRQALQLWLEWNAAQKSLTARMFQVEQNSAKVEDLMDQVEQLRLEAVRLSEQLIS